MAKTTLRKHKIARMLMLLTLNMMRTLVMTVTLTPAVVATNMCRVWIGDIDGLLAMVFRDGAVLFGCVHSATACGAHDVLKFVVLVLLLLSLLLLLLWLLLAVPAVVVVLVMLGLLVLKTARTSMKITKTSMMMGWQRWRWQC